MSVHVPPVILRSVARPIARLTFMPHTPWRHARRALEQTFACPGAPSGLAINAAELGGVPTEVLTPQHGVTRVLLYLHGGGYTTGSPRSHRALAGRLALALNAVAYVPDYRLAPEARFPSAFDDCWATYEALLDAGWLGEQIFIAGDSAGGGLALAVAVAAVTHGVALPAAIGLLCPFLDVTADAFARLPRGRRDPVLTVGLLTRFRDAYLDAKDRAHPAVSPLLADLTAVAPLVVDVAGNDLLREQSRRLAHRSRQCGVTVHYREHSGMPHGFHSGAGLVRQADRALDDVAAALLALSARQAGRPQ